MFNKIEMLLEKHNISLNRLSKKTGIPYTTLQNWKLRGSSPRLDNVKKIADYFGVPVEYFSEDENKGFMNINNIGSNNEIINGAKTTINNFQKEFSDPVKEDMFEIFDQLNDRGRKKLLEQAELLLGKYKK